MQGKLNDYMRTLYKLRPGLCMFIDLHLHILWGVSELYMLYTASVIKGLVLSMSLWRDTIMVTKISVRSPRDKRVYLNVFVSFTVRLNDLTKASPENIDPPFG